MNTNTPEESKPQKNFIEQIIDEDLASERYNRVHTRFPPEPNGFLHIGHAKSICLNFGLAKKYNGLTNLRFDDTNPETEDTTYVEGIMNDVRWLGFDWEDRLYYASDYFQQLHDWATELIKKDKAYVCHLSAEEVSRTRGTVTSPGENSPYRNRSVEENLELFGRMRKGEFKEGECTLRAKIDMSHPNMLMRDPVLYRINYTPHHRTENEWCIYPTYDYAHGQSDSIEGITHSVCTLEFEIHRPLYNWFVETLEIFHPRQIEFARLNLTYTVMSKRKLLRLVKEGYVNGWDDPRMPTISGMRRRGYTPSSIRTFAEKVGVAKRDNTIDLSLLEFYLREELNKTADRYMAVLNPLKLVITNYPEGVTEEMEAINNPEFPEHGSRKVPFSRELYIEQEDFMETPAPKYFRLAPGQEVRLRYAYFVKCTDVIRDDSGNIVEVRCTYDPDSRGGNSPDGRKVKGTLHWVSAAYAKKAEVRLYDRLFTKENPEDVKEGGDFTDNLNTESLIVKTAFCEPALIESTKKDFTCQFERIGYFCTDDDHTPEAPVFNRIVMLKDPWVKIQQKSQ
jgi:glutaminyl-tRNA synthetase